jgi:8-oxo-dGTP pyrophosphatase MutT (NUDIX family)
MHTDTMNFHVSVKALVFDEHDRLLLLQEESGIWDLPGGRIEHGEELQEALRRECCEEIGVAGDILDASPFMAWSILHSDGFWKVILCYRMQISNQTLQENWIPSSECTRFEFFTPATLSTLNLAQQMSPLAKQWQEALRR